MTDLSPDAMELFVEGLFVVRAFAGWSTEALAKMLGITRATLTKIESLEKPIKPVYYLAIKKLVDDEAYKNSCDGDATLAVVVAAMMNESTLITREELFCYTSYVIAQTGYKRGMDYLKQVLHKEFRKWVS